MPRQHLKSRDVKNARYRQRRLLGANGKAMNGDTFFFYSCADYALQRMIDKMGDSMVRSLSDSKKNNACGHRGHRVSLVWK